MSDSTNLQVLETKVVILGHTGVGKTSMLSQFVRGHFPTNTTATIGAAFMRKTIKIKGWQVVLQIWDTAGQERFRSMASMYYRGAQAAVLVYDVSQPATLEKVHSWVEELQNHAAVTSPGAEEEEPILLVAGNKSDLRAEAQSNPSDYVDQQAAVRYAESIHAKIYETSAKTGAGIGELFQDLAGLLLERHLNSEKARHSSRSELQYSGHTVSPEEDGKKQGGCCS